MCRCYMVGTALLLGVAGTSAAREAKLVRYPDFHEGKVAFTYLGDIWLADADGKNVQRLTVHKARDVSPAVLAGREVDRVLLGPRGGHGRLRDPDGRRRGQAADGALGRRDGAGLDARRQGRSCSPASGARASWASSTSCRSTAGCRGTPGPTWAIAGSFSPDGKKLAINRKAQSYWRKYYRGAYQSDVTVMDIAAKTFKDVTDVRRHGLLADVGPRRLHLLRLRPRGQRPDQHLPGPRERRRRRAGDAVHGAATSGSRRSAATARRSSSSTTSASGSSTSPAARSGRSRSRSPPRPRRP